jgi:hypothetical protein
MLPTPTIPYEPEDKNPTKYCVDCVFFDKGFFTPLQFARCLKYPKERYGDYVSPKKVKQEYNFVDIARKMWCLGYFWTEGKRK